MMKINGNKKMEKKNHKAICLFGREPTNRKQENKHGMNLFRALVWRTM